MACEDLTRPETTGTATGVHAASHGCRRRNIVFEKSGQLPEASPFYIGADYDDDVGVDNAHTSMCQWPRIVEESGKDDEADAIESDD